MPSEPIALWISFSVRTRLSGEGWLVTIFLIKLEQCHDYTSSVTEGACEAEVWHDVASELGHPHSIPPLGSLFYWGFEASCLLQQSVFEVAEVEFRMLTNTAHQGPPSY